ncbi:MAG TPA: plastocyanin/azurin family copper-binding protein [Solirubrobacteraceae bacterium]|jgi:plastocyanin|nr:plastocyanin/azurin family copper-binding protein [Solirubrobacteraceae bacterium]
MKTGLTAAIACCTLALTAGCGSSSSPTSGSTATATTGAKAASTSISPGEKLRSDTTPKFASPSPSAPVQSGLVQIAYRNIAIDPDTVRVKVGSTIRWTNYDSTPHNVTSEGGPQRFASKDFGEGGTFEITVEKPGVIHYECTLQPTTMNGTIEVVA